MPIMEFLSTLLAHSYGALQGVTDPGCTSQVSASSDSQMIQRVGILYETEGRRRYGDASSLPLRLQQHPRP